MKARTLVELVCERAETHPTRGYHFLGNGVDVSDSMTFAELDKAARKIALELEGAGIKPGARALLLYPPGLEFVRAFFGCLHAGVVTVPVPAPNPARLARTLPRLRAIAEDADLEVVLTSSDLHGAAAAMLPFAPELASKRWIATDATNANHTDWRAPALKPDDAALLQYTSGSTGTPRGVTITHGNLLDNLSAIRLFFGEQDDGRMVTWLPVYHDMGLISGMMAPLFDGADCFMMSPMEFLQDPSKWLSAISKYRGTVAGAPNFAYELCVRKVAAEKVKELDLSSLRIAYCGAEPIRKSTMDAFAERFAPVGFSAKALRPCYGLAESTLFVSGALDEGPQSWPMDPAAFLDKRVLPAAGDRDAYVVVSCGPPIPGMDVAIVNEDRERCRSNEIGEIWLRGKSVSAGYWRKPAETEVAFGTKLSDGTGPFLRTGDLGFVAPDGGLCIAGRAKDLIIVRGKNYHPHDIEATTEGASPVVRPGSTAAFSIDHARGDGEDVVVVAETDPKRARGGDVAWEDVASAIRAAVGEEHELTLHAVVLIAAGQLPKTPSGKVQRAETRRMYRANELETLHEWKAKPRSMRVQAPTARSGPPSRSNIGGFIRAWLTEETGRRTEGDASFAALGLDSLELVRLTDALRFHLARPSLSTSAALDFPTIETLAAHLAEHVAADPDEADVVEPPLEKKRAETGRVLSYWQDAVLAWEKNRAPSATWTETVRVRLRGPLDLVKLEDAIRRIAERQDALRQILVRDGTGAGTCSVLDIPIETIEVSGRTEEAIEEIYHAEASRPFELDGSPLVRFHVLRRAADDHTLLVSWHQLVHDGTGGPQIAREILEMYAARVEKRAPQLPELAVRYGDYAAWERSFFEGAGRPQVAAAIKRLARARAVELPTDRPRGGPPGTAAVGARLTLDAAATARFFELCQSQDATLYAGLVAVVGVMLTSWTGSGDLVVMSPSSSRNRPELGPLFGRFGASNPTLLALNADLTLGEAMAQVRAQAAFANEGVPAPLAFGTVDIFDHPFSRVIVNTPNMEGAAKELPGHVAGLDVTVEPVWKPLVSRNELIVIVRKKGEELVGVMTGYAALFDEATIRRRADQFVRILRFATADARISALVNL